ncbi:MAG: isoleucine--tRNA ligase, partial [Candidatus Fonsibacter sp.]
FGYDFNVPAFHGQFVSLEQGTGIVHLAPSHGPDDYYLCQKNGIEAFQSIDDKGNYTNQIKNFAGLNILKVDDVISDNLLKTGNLLGRGKLKHNYPHSWRSKAPLVHRATPQWFISMEANDLRK